jgi:hypothetical protein
MRGTKTMAPTKCPTCSGYMANIINPSTLPSHPTDPREVVGCRLGELILDELPYGKAIAFPPPVGTAPTTEFVPVPPGYKTDGPIDKDGLYVENDANTPFIPVGFPTNGNIADYDIMEGHGDLNYWEMNGTYHQVTKAMRIWYTYKQTNTAGQSRIVGTWLLIGYVGDGH